MKQEYVFDLGCGYVIPWVGDPQRLHGVEYPCQQHGISVRLDAAKAIPRAEWVRTEKV